MPIKLSEYTLAYRDTAGHRWTVNFQASSPAGALFHGSRMAPGTWGTLFQNGQPLCQLGRGDNDCAFWRVRSVVSF